MRLLNFLKLIDYEGGFSWTTVAFIVVLIKILMSPTVEWASLLTFAISNANYMHKRLINTKAAGSEDAQ